MTHKMSYERLLAQAIGRPGVSERLTVASAKRLGAGGMHPSPSLTLLVLFGGVGGEIFLQGLQAFAGFHFEHRPHEGMQEEAQPLGAGSELVGVFDPGISVGHGAMANGG